MGDYTTIEAETEQATKPSGGALTAAEVPHALVPLIQRSILNPVWNKVYRADTIRMHGIEFEVGRKNAEDLLFNLEYLTAAPGGIAQVDHAGLFWVRDTSSAAHVLEDRYTDLHEFDASIAYRRILTDRLLALDVPRADIDRYFSNRDNSWFYIMVRNVTNPGTPYAPLPSL